MVAKLTDVSNVWGTFHTLLRQGVSTAEEYAIDVQKLEGELKLIEDKLAVYRETEHEMLKYVLTFSELVKMA
ncbi:MAG: hypothetical protein COW05_04170, partial [Gammaproteobacteria bacterium CG12_big_fil_rev_8_21_14_0_65_46_12]